MPITVTNYITDYWILDNIIDCSPIMEEKLNQNSNYSESNSEDIMFRPSSKCDDKTDKTGTTKYYTNKKSENKTDSNTYSSNQVKRQIHLPLHNSRIQEYKSKSKKKAIKV